MIPKTIFTLLIFVFMMFISDVKSIKFKKAVNNNLVTYYRDITVGSATACGLLCDTDADCFSFGYDGPSKECRLSNDFTQIGNSGAKRHVYNKEIQGTCKNIIESGASTKTGKYVYFDTGTDSYVDIFCDFDHHSGIGYTYFSQSTLSQLTALDDHYMPNDHVMIRHEAKSGTQRESVIKVLPLYQASYNVSVHLSDSGNFELLDALVYPYLYLGFVPYAFVDDIVPNTEGGYEADGSAKYYVRCDDGPGNHIALSTALLAKQCFYCPANGVGTAFMDYSTLITEPDRNMPTDFYYENYVISFGGCGTRSHSYYTDSTTGIAFGIPFDIEKTTVHA